MLKFAPILLAVLYGVASRELDAQSSELADPKLRPIIASLAKALDLPRVRINIYEIEPVNGLAAPEAKSSPRSLRMNLGMWPLGIRVAE